MANKTIPPGGRVSSPGVSPRGPEYEGHLLTFVTPPAAIIAAKQRLSFDAQGAVKAFRFRELFVEDAMKGGRCVRAEKRNVGGKEVIVFNHLPILNRHERPEWGQILGETDALKMLDGKMFIVSELETEPGAAAREVKRSILSAHTGEMPLDVFRGVTDSTSGRGGMTAADLPDPIRDALDRRPVTVRFFRDLKEARKDIGTVEFFPVPGEPQRIGRTDTPRLNDDAIPGLLATICLARYDGHSGLMVEVGARQFLAGPGGRVYEEGEIFFLPDHPQGGVYTFCYAIGGNGSLLMELDLPPQHSPEAVTNYGEGGSPDPVTMQQSGPSQSLGRKLAGLLARVLRRK